MDGFLLGFCLTLAISFCLLHSKRKLVVRIKPELRDMQDSKSGTPTVGGIAFTFSITIVSLLLRLSPVWLLAMWLFAAIGFLDDMEKTHTRNGDGMKSVTKLLAQFLAAFLTVLMLGMNNLIETNFSYSAFAAFFLVYMVNAVNISDGMDGLATLMALPALCMVAVIDRNPFLLAFIGSLLGFLILNMKPAKYFMGDTGSHAIGAVLALAALVQHREGPVLVATIPFLVEFLSSFVQIVAIRLFGRKVFAIAPLHHDLQKHGLGERATVAVFSLASLSATLAAVWMMGRGGFA
ncbi:MAG: hypothetical protein SPF89_11560 [Sphaerochaetaceae bacterium]|nr:hypothetical protein [Spirochaetales bacterium]MDY5500732.1 hypothetical protein [Sphaerochaetaceae bacterium]